MEFIIESIFMGALMFLAIVVVYPMFKKQAEVSMNYKDMESFKEFKKLIPLASSEKELDDLTGKIINSPVLGQARMFSILVSMIEARRKSLKGTEALKDAGFSI